MNYHDRYGAPDPTARGAFAPWLANPARFTSPFLDGGAKWFAAHDTDGNPWFVLLEGANGETYNWDQLARRNGPGYSPLLGTFYQVEDANAAAAGITFDRRLGIAPLMPKWTRNPYANVWDHEQGTTAPGDAVPHLFRCPVRGDDGSGPSVWVNMYPDTPDLGRAALTPDAYSAGRVSLAFVLETDKGKLQIFATGNPQLRIAIISGLPGDAIGGDTWIPQAIKTLVDIVEAVIGIYTGNVGLAVAATLDTVQTWYGYAQSFKEAAARAAAQGKSIEKGAGRLLLPPAPGAGADAQSNRVTVHAAGLIGTNSAYQFHADPQGAPPPPPPRPAATASGDGAAALVVLLAVALLA